MKEIIAVVRPTRLHKIRDAFRTLPGFPGMSVAHIEGCSGHVGSEQNDTLKEELTDFLNKYPDYPFNETILKEISLSQNILIPLKNAADKFGFIDTLGTWVIQPQYDDALTFSEGFASVCKNDSCYYINKEGQKISFEDIRYRWAK